MEFEYRFQRRVVNRLRAIRSVRRNAASRDATNTRGRLPTQAAAKTRSSLLFGEVLPAGVHKILDCQHLGTGMKKLAQIDALTLPTLRVFFHSLTITLPRRRARKRVFRPWYGPRQTGATGVSAVPGPAKGRGRRTGLRTQQQGSVITGCGIT